MDIQTSGFCVESLFISNWSWYS